jgi:hypothetical protein
MTPKSRQDVFAVKVMNDPNWRLHALAAISEGLCPEHRGPLEASAGGRKFHLGGSQNPWPGGWCGQCDCWWRTEEGTTVITNYPMAVDWLAARVTVL